MFKFRKLLIIIAAVLIVGCDNGKDAEGFFTTESGIKYKYIREGGETKPNHGDIMVVNMIMKNYKDSILYESKNQPSPSSTEYRDSAYEKGSVQEAVALLKKGDSAIIKIPAEGFFAKRLPDSAWKNQYMTFEIGVTEVMSKEDYFAKQREDKLAQEVEAIATYLSTNSMEVEKDTTGLLYRITDEGEGALAQPGDTVKVHYTGKLLDGTQFDSSHKRNEPFSFVLGQGKVIKGWDIGIAKLKKGGKAEFIIPFDLGYGERQAGMVIRPYSTLFFEVELVDITSPIQAK